MPSKIKNKKILIVYKNQKQKFLLDLPMLSVLPIHEVAKKCNVVLSNLKIKIHIWFKFFTFQTVPFKNDSPFSGLTSIRFDFKRDCCVFGTYNR